jgi:vacuolar-type H+-ATPase subunit I/STV1
LGVEGAAFPSQEDSMSKKREPFEKRYAQVCKENRRLADQYREQVESARQTLEKERAAMAAERNLLYSMSPGLKRWFEVARAGFWRRLWYGLWFAFSGKVTV